MRIITPQNAALPPGGKPGEVVLGTATVNQPITADVSVGPNPLVTVPESGPYLLVIYGEVTNTSAATGTLAAQLNNNGGPLVSFSQSVTSPVANNDFFFSTIFTDLLITFEWSVTGFTTGSADIKLIASVIKLF